MRITRRAALAGGGALAWLPVLSAPLSANSVRVRFSAHSKEGQRALLSYRKAVQAMMALPRWHPHNWYYLANTHDWPGPEVDNPNTIFDIAGKTPQEIRRIQAARNLAVDSRIKTWGTCEHRTSLFLPWHRYELWYFERILEKYAGAPFALPYWDYTFDAASTADSTEARSRRALPLQFREQIAGSQLNNKLFFAQRKGADPSGRRPGKGFNDLSDPSTLHAEEVRWTDAAAKPTLLGDRFNVGFSPMLEGSPHGNVHVGLGTRLGMGTTQYAARDPIFYLHHATLDWLWESWRRAPGRIETPDAAWNQYRRYIDVNGALAQALMQNTLTSANPFDYAYDRYKAAPPLSFGATVPSPFGPEAVQTIAAPTQTGAIAVPPTGARIPMTVAAGGPGPFGPGAAQRYTLVLTGISVPDYPATAYAAYINLPVAATGAARLSYLAGTFTFFGVHSHTHDTAGPLTVDHRFDVTELLAQEDVRRSFDQRQLVFVVEPLSGGDETPLTIQRIEIVAN